MAEISTRRQVQDASRTRGNGAGSGTSFALRWKHIRTEVEGSRKKRIYDQPLTPFERLKACPGADPKQMERMEKLMATLNPFKLKATIERKLRRVLRLANRPNLKSAA